MNKNGSDKSKLGKIGLVAEVCYYQSKRKLENESSQAHRKISVNFQFA